MIHKSIINYVKEPKKPTVLHESELATLPERVLVLALLERAARDLSPIVDAHSRKQAIFWFKNPHPKVTIELSKEYDCRFTFGQVIEILNLGARELGHLIEKVKRAENCEEERTQRYCKKETH